jgi:hypothetical protein
LHELWSSKITDEAEIQVVLNKFGHDGRYPVPFSKLTETFEDCFQKRLRIETNQKLSANSEKEIKASLLNSCMKHKYNLKGTEISVFPKK